MQAHTHTHARTRTHTHTLTLYVYVWHSAALELLANYTNHSPPDLCDVR